MSNPFDDKDGKFFVLVNEEGQHSLWPTFVNVPSGWRVTHGPESHTSCMEFVDKSWTDLRPRSLVSAMDKEKNA